MTLIHEQAAGFRTPKHMAGFERALSRISNIDTIPVVEPGVTNIEAEIEAFGNVDARPNTYHLPVDLAEQLPSVSPGGIEFILLRSTTNRKSAHGVFFGTLACDDLRIQVAVKHQGEENGWKLAAREHMLTQAFCDMGFYTPEPAGIILDQDPETGTEVGYSLTRLYPGLTTLDSISSEEWADFWENPSRHKGMKEIWSGAADEIAHLHDIGSVRQGDLWARNIATSPGQLAFLIDHERARIDPIIDPPADVRHEYSLPDIHKVLLSICLPHDVPGSAEQGLGIISDQFRTPWFEVFSKVFFDEYVQIRHDLASEQSPANQREIREEVAQLSQDMKGYSHRLQVQLQSFLET